MSAVTISAAMAGSTYDTTTCVASSLSKTNSIILTRRGRMLLLGLPILAVSATLLLTLLTVMFGVFANPANASSNQNGASVGHYTSTVTVLQGQSLWSIAAKSDPKRDVRDVVADIVALNELPSGVVQAGQQLFVPLSH